MGTSSSPNIVVAHRTCGSTRRGVQDWRLSMKCSAKEVLALKITTESYLRGARAFSVFSVFGHVLLETHQRLKSIQSPLSVSQFER